MAISNDLLSSTLYSIRDREVDQLYRKTAFLEGVRKFGGIETEDGGIKIQRPLSVVDHSTLTQLSTGYEPVSLAVSDVMKPAIYEWADFAAPVVITKREELENNGEKAVVKIVEARMRNVMSMFKRELNKQILAGSSTILTDLNTLNGEASSTGFLEAGAAAAATQTNTVGGLQKSVLDVPGWYNAFKNGSTSTINDDLTEVYQDSNQFSGSGEIKLVICNPATFKAYKASLFSQERYIDSKVLDGGNLSLAFHGAELMQDNEMPANAGASTAFSAVLLNFDAIKLVMHSQGDYAVGPFEHISGTTARAAQVYWKGQLIADHLRGCGLLSGI